MRLRLLLVPLQVLMLAGAPARAQLLPITTASDEAREHFLLGREAAHHFHFMQAIEHLDAALAADSGFVLALIHRAGSTEQSARAERQHYFERAEAHRSRVSEGEQRMIDAFRAFLLDGKIERAVEIFRDLSAEYAADPYLPTYLALRYYRNLGRIDEAEEQFRRAIQRDSSFAQAYNWLGYIALDRQDYVAAQEAFHHYVRLAPDQPRPYNSLGTLYLTQGRYEEAALQFEQAFARDSRFVESRDNLVRSRISQVNRRFEEAVGRQDAAAVAELFTQTARLLPAGSGAIEGTEAIGRYWQSGFDAGLTSAKLETLEVYVGAEGETATEVGSYRFTSVRQQADVGKYVVVWQRTADGWKIHRDIWTTDRASQAR